MTNPLQPKPTDGALLDKLLTDDRLTRNYVILLRALAVGTKVDGTSKLMTEASDALRVLYNQAKERQAV